MPFARQKFYGNVVNEWKIILFESVVTAVGLKDNKLTNAEANVLCHREHSAYRNELPRPCFPFPLTISFHC